MTRLWAGTTRGFTLIELVLVTAIIGVVSAIAVPRYLLSLSRYRAQAAAECIDRQLTQASERARFSSAARQWWIDASTMTLTIAKSVSGSWKPVRQIDLTAAPLDVTSATSTFTPGNPLTFSGYGQASRSGTVTVQVGGETRRISLDAATGEVTIQ